MDLVNFRLYWNCSGLGAGESRHVPGEFVDRSGVDRMDHVDGRDESVVLVRGQKFPLCACCADGVRYQLVRAAPYIYEDEDFQED